MVYMVKLFVFNRHVSSTSKKLNITKYMGGYNDIIIQFKI